MEVIWSPRASAEFAAQVRYLEQRFGPRQSTRYLHEVLAAIEKVLNPLMDFQLVREQPETRCCPVNKQVKLYYRPGTDSVELVTFFDTRQSPDKLQL